MRFKPWLVVIVVCIALVAILGAIKFFQIKTAIEFGESFPEPSETVETETLSLSDWRPSIRLIASLRAPQELELRNEVTGVIAKIGFASGQRIEAGQLLLQLDVAEEEARLQAIKPQIKLAQENVKRIAGLSNKGAVSKQQSDNFTSQLAVAKAEAATVKEQIANKTLFAPFDGTAGLHDFEVGEFLAENTLITQFVGNTDTLWLDFALPQQYSKLAIGTYVTINNTEQLVDSTLRARVIAVEPRISTSSRSLNARAELQNTSSRLTPGGSINITVPVGANRQVFRVSNTAIRADAFGAFVFVLQKGEQGKLRAAKRPIQVVAKEGEQSIIENGLEVGEIIAAKGSFKLREGLLANVSQANAVQNHNDVSPVPSTNPVNADDSLNKAELSPDSVKPVQPDVIETGIDNEQL